MKILTLSNYVETVKNAWDYARLAHKIRNRRIGIWELGPWKLKQKTIFIAFELCPISVSLMPSLLFLQLNCNIAVHWITVSWNFMPSLLLLFIPIFLFKKKKIAFFFFLVQNCTLLQKIVQEGHLSSCMIDQMCWICCKFRNNIEII